MAAGSDLRVCYDDMYGLDVWCATCKRQVVAGPSLYRDVEAGWSLPEIVTAAAEHDCVPSS